MFKLVKTLFALVGTLVLAGITTVGHATERYDAQGYDYARVVAATPIYERYEQRIPERQCRIETVQQTHPSYPERRSTTPGLAGAVIGGALGHAVGNGKKNKRIGTAVGALLGASIGRDVGHQRANARAYPRVSYHDVERCEVRDRVETRRELVGYDVDYEYQGRLYSTRMNRDPGAQIKVAIQVTPVQ